VTFYLITKKKEKGERGPPTTLCLPRWSGGGERRCFELLSLEGKGEKWGRALYFHYEGFFHPRAQRDEGRRRSPPSILGRGHVAIVRMGSRPPHRIYDWKKAAGRADACNTGEKKKKKRRRRKREIPVVCMAEREGGYDRKKEKLGRGMKNWLLMTREGAKLADAMETVVWIQEKLSQGGGAEEGGEGPRFWRYLIIFRGKRSPSITIAT